MRKNHTLSAAPTRGEILWGLGYLAFQMLVLPTILTIVSLYLPNPLSSAELNFCYFLINFLAVSWIFHSFLGKNMAQARSHPAYLCQAVILGFCAYWASSYAVGKVIGLIAPGYANLNDKAISGMVSDNFFLMALGTVVLAPPAEECLFRGAVFRGLYSKSRWAAYLVSMAAFSLVHIVSFLGQYSPMELLVSFLMYLPAGLCLAWSYTKADTIFAPIIMHALINAYSIYAMR